MGAHEDSINLKGSRAPGADDDGTLKTLKITTNNITPYIGSGVSAVLEIFRVLVGSGIKFNRTIQFMTYAAEEGSFKAYKVLLYETNT